MTRPAAPGPAARAALGRQGEQRAAQWLQARGWQLLAQNYATRQGEADIIALDGDTVVFMEVKTRTTRRYGTGAEAVGPAKQRRIIAAALAYLQQQGWLEKNVRFDLLAWEVVQGKWQMQWLPGAFEAPAGG